MNESDLLQPLDTPAPPMREVQMKPYYELGNCLRGYFGGYFWTDEEAWDVLSDRFNRGYPSRNGRGVEMRKTIRRGLTAGGNETERDRRLREHVEAILAERKAAEGVGA
jgi:hypothetical protein